MTALSEFIASSSAISHTDSSFVTSVSWGLRISWRAQSAILERIRSRLLRASMRSVIEIEFVMVIISIAG